MANQPKQIIENKEVNWSLSLRPKVGSTVKHNNLYWTNVTGLNSEPGTSDDWLLAKGSSVQSDFNQSDTEAFDFIKNKPIQALTDLNLSGSVSIDITRKQSYIYNFTGNVDLTIDTSNIDDNQSYVTELRITTDTDNETLTLLNSTDTKDIYGIFNPKSVNKIVISATKDGSGNVYLTYFINQPN